MLLHSPVMSGNTSVSHVVKAAWQQSQGLKDAPDFAKNCPLGQK